MYSFCAMDRSRRPGSPLRSFERYLRAQNRGAHRRQPLGEPRLAQAFLEGRARQLEEATGPTWRTSWAMSGPSRPPACTGTALRRTLLW
jgi:hypothetical protein